MIRKPNEVQTREKKLRMLVAGYPGIGKTTLGLSAPNALHIDIDCGIDRIEPMYRRPYIQPNSYQEILDDLVPMNLTEFDTLVFDTGGKLLDLMKPWVIEKNIKNGHLDGTLSQKGYGAVGREFARLMDYCHYELDKHIVLLFHAVEDKDSDNTRLRLMIEGGTKNTVWISMDLGGFLEMQGNKRTLGLSNCERYFAKGNRGINGILSIPSLRDGDPNNFLTRLFEQYASKEAADAEALDAYRRKYEEVMKRGMEIIEAVKDAVSANLNMSLFKDIEHVLTSKRELGAAWNRRIKELGIEFDKAQNAYVERSAEE